MAYEYAVSFDIKADSTYSERYTSLMDQLRKTPGSPGLWSETTSVVLLRSDETIEELEHRLYYSSQLSSAKDKLLVIDTHSGVAVARGPIAYPATLAAHFKSCAIK